MNGRFAGKTVLVTGGATGIGFATASRFSSEGAAVAIMGIKEDEGREAERKLQASGARVIFMQGDVTKEEDGQRCIDEAVRQFGRLDVLVNNAAISTTIEFLTQDMETWRRVFDTIAMGVFLMTRLAARYMIENGIHGSIINVSSINSHRAQPLSSHYNAAKGAVDQLTRCAAVEFAPYGIRVNAVRPGFIHTPMSIVDGENELETDWFRDIYVKRRKIPQARHGNPEEVAAVIAFLASDDASYICGATIPVDGGLSITF